MESLSRCSVEVDVGLAYMTVVDGLDYLCTPEKAMQDWRLACPMGAVGTSSTGADEPVRLWSSDLAVGEGRRSRENHRLVVPGGWAICSLHSR